MFEHSQKGLCGLKQAASVQGCCAWSLATNANQRRLEGLRIQKAEGTIPMVGNEDMVESCLWLGCVQVGPVNPVVG